MTEEFKTPAEHLELRTGPRPIRKINKRALLLGCGVSAIVVGGATIAAFNPDRVGGATAHTELYNTEHKQTAEGLEMLPKSYADLDMRPGLRRSADVAHLMIEGERKVTGLSEKSNLPIMPSPEEEAESAEHIRQMRLAAQAKESGLFIRLSEKNDGHGQTASTSNVASGPSAVVQPALVDDHEALVRALARTTPARDGALDRGSENIPSSQVHKLAFVNRKADRDATNASDLALAPSPYTIMAGSLLAASLVTGLNSDLPGIAIAQITENVFDTVTGEHLLIPQGARLMGKYDSVIAFGQRRALVVWNRIILPNGDSVAIDNLPAVDGAGYAGLEDDVDMHSWHVLKGIGLATVFGISSELTLGNNGDTIVQALRQSVQTNTSQAGQHMVERELDVQPTITVRPGWPLRVIVAKDLVLKPYRVGSLATE